MADQTEKDPFHYLHTYPDAPGLISWAPQSLEDVRDSAAVVIDTNALLVPLETGKASLAEIGKTYRPLVEQGRLVIPGHAAREFVTHRVTKLKDLHQQLARKRALLSGASYPLLEGLNGYSDMKTLERQLRDAIDSVLTEIRRWRWNDPVSALYAELFRPGVVQDPQFDEADLQQDLTQRRKNATPPGYKDGGIGDLIIWRTILEIGKSRRAPLLFVSGDQKADWWHQSEGHPLYPRFELVDEYRRHSEGQVVHLLTFADFLDLFGANPSTVEEVRKEEQELSQRSPAASTAPTTAQQPSAQTPPNAFLSPGSYNSMAAAIGNMQIPPEILRGITDFSRNLEAVGSAAPRSDFLQNLAMSQPRIFTEFFRQAEEAKLRWDQALKQQITPEFLRQVEEARRRLEEAMTSPDLLRAVEEANRRLEEAFRKHARGQPRSEPRNGPTQPGEGGGDE